MDRERIRQAADELMRYKAGRASLERRVIDNEQWYKLRHWEQIGHSRNPGDPEPVSAWLLNSIANKHADAMDNYPSPIVLPREQSDAQAAHTLSQVLPLILEQGDFESAWSDMWWRKLKSGTGVMGVFWNTRALGGLGEAEVRNVDLLSVFWEPGITDLQASRNLFVVELRDVELLEAEYPELRDRLAPDSGKVARYIYDDSIDTSKKACVVDWYYKKDGRLHLCKFVDEEVLFASEDEEIYRDGFYAHGKYPFVFDTLFPVEGSPAGFGYLDVCKDAQMYIDKLNQVILKNALMASRPRWFVRQDSGIKEEEYADWSRDFVHFTGNFDQDAVHDIKVNTLDNVYVAVLNGKIEELKETSGNRDFSQGGTTSGVTAASAIAALQEAGSKLSRDMLKSSYRAFAQVCYLALELIRQFYDTPRYFRITGEQGEEQFVRFENAGLRPQAQGQDFGLDLGERAPIFDIKVRVARANAFSQVAQNEMAKEFYSAGFFNPQLSDQALACLEMMDFEGKDAIVRRIAQNGTLYTQLQAMQGQLMQLTAIVDRLTGGSLGASLPQMEGQKMPPSVAGGGVQEVNALGRAVESKNAGARGAARQRAERTANPT